MKEGILYNGEINWNPEFTIEESDDKQSKKLVIGGVALVEGLSRNKNRYKVENLKENDGREFKWLVGHPKTADPDFVVGKGNLSMEGEILKHEGWIMNTAKFPDLIEKVQEGLLGPSIHASFEKLQPVKTEEGVEYHVSGLNIEGIGLVSFQGVKSASIDYAIQEAYESASSEEATQESSDNEVSEDNHGGDKMEENMKKLEEQNAELQAKVNELELSRKESLVEELCGMNDSLVKEELMKESEEVLKLRKDYELKLVKESEEAAKAEEEKKEESEKKEEEKDEEGEAASAEPVKGEGEKEVAESFVVEKDGSMTFSEKGYSEFSESFKLN